MVKDLKNRAGLTLGILFAIMHTAWITIVGSGMGSEMANSWRSMHFLGNQTSIGTFGIGTGLLGIAFAFVAGYVIGWLFIAIWDWVGTKVK